MTRTLPEDLENSNFRLVNATESFFKFGDLLKDKEFDLFSELQESITFSSAIGGENE